jgi:hypothetical protein
MHMTEITQRPTVSFSALIFGVGAQGVELARA